MKTMCKHIVVALVVAFVVTGCVTLGSAPSYVPSPFSDSHGQ